MTVKTRIGQSAAGAAFLMALLGVSLLLATPSAAIQTEPDSADRLAFVPLLGLTASEQEVAANTSNPVAQNAGAASTRYLALLFAPAGAGCVTCTLAYAACSPPIAPRGTWNVPLPADHNSAASAVIFSLTRGPASLPPGFGTGAGAPAAAEAICTAFGAGYDELAPVSRDICPLYSQWHAAFIHGGDFLDIPHVEFLGEPIAVVARPTLTHLDGRLLGAERYAALGGLETAAGITAANGLTYTYYVPGVHFEPPDGFTSRLTVQNAGSECASVTVTASVTGDGPFGAAVELDLPPGGAWDIPASVHWPFQDTGALVVNSTGPVATVLATRSFDTASVHTGLRARSETAEWVSPLAYQEKRVLPLADSDVPTFDGWQSYFSVFNPSDTGREIRARVAWAGGSREFRYMVRPGRQSVFQVGFQMDRTGGEGTVTWDSLDGVIYVTQASLREAEGSPRIVEDWAVPLWERGDTPPAPYSIALPDLGGPALGDAGDPGGAEVVTGSLTARVALKNTGLEEALVMVDGAPGCVSAGTDAITIPPGMALTLPASAVPGTDKGHDSALLRVMTGEVAAILELASRRRVSTDEDPPPDSASAYLGIARAGVPPPPVAPTATLLVTPTLVALGTGDEPGLVTVEYDQALPLCAEFTTAWDAPWLVVSPTEGTAPADLELRVRRSLLAPGEHYSATLTIQAESPQVRGSPAEVTVLVSGPSEAVIYAPSAYTRQR